jgi:DNA-binding MarR family transcriptional regulator
LEELRKKECSLRELETKTNTNYRSIVAHLRELEYLGFVEIIEHEKSENTGRPYTTAKLTLLGRNAK